MIYKHIFIKYNFLQAAKLLKTQMYKHKVTKNDKLIKAWIKLKLLIGLGIIKERSL